MAAVITAKLSQRRAAIVGAPIRLVLNVANSDPTTAASVVGVQLAVRPATVPVAVQQVPIMVGQTVQVPVSSSINFDCGLTFFGNQKEGVPAQPGLPCEAYAVVTMDDGQVIASAPFAIDPTRAVVDAPAYGEARFDWGGVNSYMVRAVL